MIHATCQGCFKNWAFTEEEASGYMEHYNLDEFVVEQCPLCGDEPTVQYVGHA
jgi:hypothetical protein